MKDLLKFSPKYSNHQKLLFKIINKNIDDTFNVEFEIDGLILNNQTYNKIYYGYCYHPNKKYVINLRVKYFYHIIYFEASKYNSKKDFLKFSKNYYHKAYNENWLDEICLHMNKPIKYDINYCHKIAFKYSSRIEFQNKNQKIYAFAYRHNWLDEICSHMNGNIKHTNESIINKAKLCKTRTEFSEKYPNEYYIARKRKLLIECYKHIGWNGRNKLTKEFCLSKAKLCKSKVEFSEKYQSSYCKALKMKWLDEICLHMNQFLNSNNFPRLIYAYIFNETKTIYIGLTKNFQKRHRLRIYKNNDCVMNYINQYGIKYQIVFLTEFLSTKEAQIKEQEFIDLYKLNGWNLLNINKGGSLGSNPKRIKI